MGTGKNGTFDKTPDLNQWAIMAAHKNEISNTLLKNLYGNFINKWFSFFTVTNN